MLITNLGKLGHKITGMQILHNTYDPCHSYIAWEDLQNFNMLVKKTDHKYTNNKINRSS